MNKKIENILSDLYENDPGLKKNEKQIIKILERLNTAGTRVEIDKKFQIKLRTELLKKEIKTTVPFFRKTSIRLTLAAIVSVAALAIVFIPMVKYSDMGQAESTMEMMPVRSEAPMAKDGLVLNRMSIQGEVEPEMVFGNTEEYDRIHENAFLNTIDNPLSTFSIDVDTASYANVRRFLQNGSLPYADAVRIEEMINYFNYSYPDPEGDHPFSINTEVTRTPWNESNLLLRIGLQGERLSFDTLPPNNLVFLLDVSGSMNDQNKLPLLKSALKMVVKNMRDKDSIAIVVYAGAAGTVLEPTTGENREEIIAALDRLEAGGSTAGAEGIKLAYKKAMENFDIYSNNRIILATDGDFNVGVSSDAELERLIEKKRDSGVFLTVLGFGMGNYKDSKMEIIADKGNGNYAYIDSILEAKKVLVEEMGGTFFTIAKDVKLQIEFNPALVSSYRLIGYENRMMAREDFDDDTKDAGELGAGHSVTALYELVPADGDRETSDLKYQSTAVKETAMLTDELLTIKFRYKRPDSNVSRLIEKVVKNDVTDFELSSDDTRFATSVAQWGMLLRDSEYKGSTSFEQIIETAGSARGDDGEGYRNEFIRLVKLSRQLSE